MRNQILKIILITLYCYSIATAQFSQFITARGDKLMDGSRELRFVSYNIPNLHMIEDNHEFTNPNPWRLPDEYEIRDALLAIKQSGGKVTRIYVPSVRKEIDNPDIIRHVDGPGKFNEEAFRVYDKVLQLANEIGIRIIIPFVDNWFWWGGVAEYAKFRGKSRDSFWTDSLVISDFKKTIGFMINRVNTYTGVQYRDDKAILGWETGNELQVPDFAWTKHIANYIKSIDKNHLVIEGTYSQAILDESIEDPNIDVLSTHHYGRPFEALARILAAKEKTKGRKPYFIGEFGYMPTDSMQVILDSVISSGVSGILLWSMRQHNRDGGFYYHGYSYRWPGFEEGKNWDEINVMRLVREKAFQINGEIPSQLPIPESPKLLPIETPYKISWQGSTGASSYIIERKSKLFLFFWHWSVIDSNASDANIGYRPLFSDTTAEPGKTYYYRLKARNSSGISNASETVGPIKTHCRMLIDEFENDKKMYSKSAEARFIYDKDLHRAKEDRHRLEGADGCEITYILPDQIISIQLDAFFTTYDRENNILFFSGISSDNLEPLQVTVKTYEVYKNMYNAYCPVRYVVKEIPINHRYVKISLAKNIQLSRLEIEYAPE